jgi:hypothetical protein
MSDIADMILIGFLCQQCSGIIEDHNMPGYPRTCEDCKEE